MRGLMVAGQPELICCPEAHDDFLAPEWYGAFSRPDYGYPLMPGRRKVTLWSRSPWKDVDDLGAAELPTGRFVMGMTTTTLGDVRVVGVCVPWADAHVSSGRRDRRKWEDHVRYLQGLRTALKSVSADCPTIVIGDINQCIPRRAAPARVYDELQPILGNLAVWTQGDIAGLDRLPVCHIMGTADLVLKGVHGYSRKVNGRDVSDHDGLMVDVVLDAVSGDFPTM
ncbi:hypothetical protein [Mesorhizobium sp.]|uniref:hypothetical protein n=1 Tax=Mesorhizobium sp. TaxID=1871066 RepID=UPI0025D0D64A|nr:hypothetical protein [Mesorhizobium sp.]